MGSQTMAFCPRCNGEIGVVETACSHCGYDFPAQTLSSKSETRTSLRSAIKDGGIISLVMLLLTSCNLDGGVLFRLCLTASLGYWAGVGMAVLRRRLSPTTTDLLFMRWGSLALTIASPGIAALVYTIIGRSEHSGLDRLLHGTLM